MAIIRTLACTLAAILIAGSSASAADRIALVIGNAAYPDADDPLTQSLRDATAISSELQRAGFDVIAGENLGGQALRSRIEVFNSKISPGSVVLLFFSGYGIQSERQTYLIPVDVSIWCEDDVKRLGIPLDPILAAAHAKQSSVNLVILDAARRNPFERRFRRFSAGLAPLSLPPDTLALVSTGSNTVVDDTPDQNSVFVTELLKRLPASDLSADAIFDGTRIAVAQATHKRQSPQLMTSLVEPFYFFPSKAGVPQPKPARDPCGKPTQRQSGPMEIVSPEQPPTNRGDTAITAVDGAIERNRPRQTATPVRGSTTICRCTRQLGVDASIADHGGAITLNPRLASNDVAINRTRFEQRRRPPK